MYSHQLKDIAVDKRASWRRSCPSVTGNLSLDIAGFEAAEIDTFLCDFVDPEQDVPDEPHAPPKQRSVVLRFLASRRPPPHLR
jgi:hypothetical protein